MRKLQVVLYGAIFLIAFVIILVAFCRPFNKVSNRRETTATVTDKTVKNGKEESKYLVYTKTADGEVAVFEITDALFAFRFNSSDVYAGIEV